MPFLAPIGAAIAAGFAVVQTAVVVVGLDLAAMGGVGAVAGSVVLSAGGFIGSLGGAMGIAAAISSWSTVALFASSFLSKPKVGQGPAGSQVDLQADPNAGIPLMLGRSGTAGKVLHANTSGSANKNAALYYLLALTGGPLGGFESLTASDFLVTLAGDTVTAPAQYAGSMFRRTTPGQKPDPGAYYPGGVQPAWIPEWTDAHRLSGVACAWLTFSYNTKAYPSGMPKPMFVLRGPPVYDPRADSTYPGGSGPQRWNDETTWGLAGNENPFLQGLAWVIGRHDGGKLSFGIGAPIDGIDVASFVEGANVCDANDWKVGGEVLSSDRKWDCLTTILQAGGGEPLKLGGLIAAHVRAPRVVLGTVVGRDLVDAASITGTKRRRDRLNQIIPSYRSEDHGWELVPADPVFVNEYIAADGGLRSKEGSYPLVQQVAQVAQLATYDILDAREFEPIVLPLGPRWQAIRPGDCILIDEPEFGMTGQPVIVQTREFDLLTGRVTLTCRSETAGKHDYALGKTTAPPPIPGLQPQNPGFVARPDAGTWTAVGTALVGADGSQVPAIVVTGAINDPNVSGIIVEYQLQLSPGVFGGWVSNEFPSTTRRMELLAVVSGGTYHVQVRYRSVRNVEGDLALDLGLVTVGTSISGGVSTIGGQTPEDLIQQLNATTALGLQTAKTASDTANDLLFTNQNLHDKTTLPDGTDLETYTVNSVTTLTTNVNNAQGSASYAVTRVDAIGVLQPDGRSFWMSDATLFAAPGQSWGSYKLSLQNQIGGNTSAITTEQTTRADADSALASDISDLHTTVGEHTSDITLLQSSVNGLDAQWVLSVSSTGPGYARVAGIKVAANPAVSSIAFQADQIGFSNGTDNVYPLAVVGNKVIATNFQADDIKANTVNTGMLKAQIITTDKIIANNISVTTRSAIPAAITLVDTQAQQVDIISTVFTASGGYVDLDVWGNVNHGGLAGIAWFTLYIDGAAIENFGSALAVSANNQITYSYRHKPAAGNHTYLIRG